MAVVPNLELYWLSWWLYLAVPEWLNASFFAAAGVGFATQLSFSYVASRESRQLNQRTGAALGELKGLVVHLQRSLAEVSTVSLTIQRNLVELSGTGLVQATDGDAAGYGHDGGVVTADGGAPAGRPAALTSRTASPDLPQRIQQVIGRRGRPTLREVYDELADQATLLSLLYALYRLRGDGVVAWVGAQIGWDTPLWLTSPQQS